MERLNVTACRNNPTEIFVTLFIGVLDIKTGQLSYCNAGHERPLLAGKPLDAMPNMAIGVLDDFEYVMQQTTIEAGDTICLYTDGLTEALNAQHKLFGRQRAMQLIARLNNMPPKTMVDTIVSEVKQYAGHTEQSDDLTLLAISYRPKH